LKEFENQIIELPYFPTCKYDKTKNNRRCPTCKKKNKVIPIYYGLIGQIGKKKSNFKSGGCVVTGRDPNWFCERDGTEFLHAKMINKMETKYTIPSYTQ
jgi:hypothetical protein